MIMRKKQRDWLDKKTDDKLKKDVTEWKNRGTGRGRGKAQTSPKIAPKLPPVPVTIDVHYSIGSSTGEGKEYPVKYPCKEPNHHSFPPKGIYGWICPVCGRGMSPFANSCNCNQSQEPFKVTCCTSTNSNTDIA